MASFTNNPKLGDRYAQALQFAFQAHQNQIRKQEEIPYITHLMSVSALVLEAGGSEDEAIAALLHDYFEDIDPENGLSVINLNFGFKVREMVRSLSASDNETYIWQISKAGDAVKLVSCADKLHNLRGYSTTGRSLWNDAKTEFYGQLMPIYERCDRVPREWIEEMKILLASLTDEGIVSLSKTEFLALQEWASQGMEWEREFQ